MRNYRARLNLGLGRDNRRGLRPSRLTIGLLVVTGVGYALLHAVMVVHHEGSCDYIVYAR